MIEYISRDAVLKVLRGSAVGKYPASFYPGLAAAADEVEKIPTADVQDGKSARWISLDEDLPAFRVPVVGIVKDTPFSKYEPMVVMHTVAGWVSVRSRCYVTDVTHWMPLPEPPEMDGGQSDD